MHEFLVNLPTICLFIAILACLIAVIYNFVCLPASGKREALKEWLKWAVTVAEKEYGGKTGQLKLRYVWEMALEQFPWLVRFVSFDDFSFYVDEALEWLKTQLESNEAMKAICSK